MFLLGVVLVLVAGVSVQPGYEDSFREIRSLVQQNRLGDALPVAESLVATSPDRPEAYFALGDLYRRLWRPREAVDVFLRALSATRGEPVELHREIAVTYAEIHAWESALEHVDRSLALAPFHPPTLYTKAMVLSQRGARNEALRLYEGLLEGEPDNAMLHFRIGELHESMNRTKQAERAYRRAIALDPAAAGARFRFGKLLFASGRAKQAERELARAVALSRTHAESHLELAHALDALERSAKARHHFQRALELDPSLATAYLGYGNFVLRQGDRERGLALLAKFEELTALEQRTADLLAAVDFAPHDFEAEETLVRFLVEREQFPLALRAVQRSLLGDLDDERHYLLLAWIYREWGRDEDALRTLEQARARFPESEAVHRALAQRP